MRTLQTAFVSLALCALFVVTAAPNRRAHDHLTDHNWQLEIEGVTMGDHKLPTRLEFTGQGSCPIADVDQVAFVDEVERAFEDAVRRGADARANILGEVSNALVEQPGPLVQFKRLTRSAPCVYSVDGVANSKSVFLGPARRVNSGLDI